MGFAESYIAGIRIVKDRQGGFEAGEIGSRTAPGEGDQNESDGEEAGNEPGQPGCRAAGGRQHQGGHALTKALRGIDQPHGSAHGRDGSHGVGHARDADGALAFEVFPDLRTLRIVRDTWECVRSVFDSWSSSHWSCGLLPLPQRLAKIFFSAVQLTQVFTVPSGSPMRSAISVCESPS